MCHAKWTLFMVMISLLAQPGLLRGEEVSDSKQLNKQSSSELFEKLKKLPRDQRKEIRDVLFDRALTIAGQFAAQVPERYSSISQRPTEKVDPAVIKKWTRELEELTPRLLTYLIEEPADEWSPAIEMLLVTDPKASFLEQHRDQIITSPEKRWTLLGEILKSGIDRLPRNQSCLEVVLREWKELTSNEHQHLKDIWESRDSKDSKFSIYSLFGPTTAGIAIMFASSDRVQVELPFLGKLISTEYPTVLRMMSLSVIVELKEDAAPILPVLQEQLADDDREIRLQVAYAIAMVAPREVDIAKLVKQADLSEEDSNRLETAIRMVVKEANEMDEFLTDQSDEYAKRANEIHKRSMLDAFQSGHQFFIRQSLRSAIAMKSDASFVQEELKKVLELDNLDAETQRLANLALKAIHEE